MRTSFFAALVLAASPHAVRSADAPATRTPDYRPITDWPALPKNIELGPVSAVATDAEDRVFVVHRGKTPLLVFGRDGTFLRGWGHDSIKTPHGLRIDHDGNLWMTDIGNHLVMKFDPAGTLLLTVGVKGEAGADEKHFDRPTDVAVRKDGSFYVTDGYGNSRVLLFAKDGRLIRQWGTKGNGDGQFNLPHSVVLDGRGRVLVGDRENNRIQVFDGDAKFLAAWTASGAPYGLFRHGDRTLVADGRANWVRILDADGKTIGRFGERGTGPGQFQMPHMLCVDSRDSVYVAEVTGKRIQKFSPMAE